MVTAIIVDTSALFALLDASDQNNASAARAWHNLADDDLVVHGYVVAEAMALVRSRIGWPAASTLIDDLLPRLRVEMVERHVHDAAVADYRSLAGGTSFVDRVTIAFARENGITRCFAFDPDLTVAGLKPVA